MKLYKLKQDQPYYSELTEIVVLADSPRAARIAASLNCGKEGKDVWLNKGYSSCKLINIKDGVPILKSFMSD